jgi:hypothetical protein
MSPSTTADLAFWFHCSMWLLSNILHMYCATQEGSPELQGPSSRSQAQVISGTDPRGREHRDSARFPCGGDSSARFAIRETHNKTGPEFRGHDRFVPGRCFPRRWMHSIMDHRVVPTTRCRGSHSRTGGEVRCDAFHAARIGAPRAVIVRFRRFVRN